MDIDEINDHIHKLKFGSTDWQSVEKLAALCTVRNELEEKQAPAEMQTQALPFHVLPDGILHKSKSTKRVRGSGQRRAFWRLDGSA